MPILRCVDQLSAAALLVVCLLICRGPIAAAEPQKAESSAPNAAKDGGKKDGKKDTPPEPLRGIKIGTFKAEVRQTYTTDHGLPTNNTLSIAVDDGQNVFAGTSRGLAKFADGGWGRVTDYDGPVKLIAPHKGDLIGVGGDGLYLVKDGSASKLADLPQSARDPATQHTLVGGKQVLLGTSAGLFELKDDALAAVDALNALLGADKEIRQVATASDGRVAVAAASGLFLATPQSNWQSIQPHEGGKSWAPRDVRGVAFDTSGRLWFCSPQGVGMQEGDAWKLMTGQEGLPYNDFTTITAGEEGVVWFGTRMGAIRYDGKNWEYRMAPRWLPDNLVRGTALSKSGDAWFATEKGVGSIERRPMTLAEKARFFEEEIDKYNRRTPFGFVISAHLKNPADKSEWTNGDSDNDGLWTSMYGAGECFAYAATKDPKAKQRAKNAFEAVRFLSQVTQGGSHPAPPGFPARTILPTSGENPNEKHYTPAKDAEEKAKDPQWKVMDPRWPTSADGQWFWKSDTSSDELDGHYFLYACYFDLVAETVAEKARVRDVVVAITDHLIDHGFDLIDHDGKPTRWARYAPAGLNGGETLFQRGLNSLSMLSYLKVALHISGEQKYQRAYRELIDKHGYLANILAPKAQNGAGSGNQSDDEMAFMCYYNLLGYEANPQLKLIYTWTLYNYWKLEEPELCPFFNYVFAARLEPNPEARKHISKMFARQSCLDEALDTLVRYPLDRIRWPYKNSHRIDLVPLPEYVIEHKGTGHRRDGKVIPIDERSIEHWNHGPWRLDEDGDGRTLTDGAAFLLPYYMGLYYKFIIEG